ncbi:MAG: hypothetical protein FJ029_13755 [Actinobacteria bacterium]|nr:hypothetical protein [Actinomycetota bacterium]
MFVVVAGLFTAYVLAVVGVLDWSWLSGVDRSAQAGPVLAEQSAPREHIVTVLNRDITDDGKFDVLVTAEDANGLLNGELGSGAPVQDLKVGMRAGSVRVDGSLKGRFPVPFGATLAPRLGTDGRVQIILSEVSVSVLPLPGFAEGPVNDLTNQVVDFNRLLGQTTAVRFTAVDASPAGLRLAGTASEPIRLPDGKTPGARAGPPPAIPKPRDLAAKRPVTVPPADAWTYVAIGDSLTAGDGASDLGRTFPARFHRYLIQTLGVPVKVQSLGISGQDSRTWQDGPTSQIERALQLINDLKNDGDASTRVHLITMTMGANDIFPVLKSQTCFTNPQGAACQGQVDAAIVRFEQNMAAAAARLKGAVEPGTLLIIMSYYNPFNFGTGLIFETVTQQTVDKLNAAIQRVASANGLTIADVGGLCGDLAFRITHIGAGDIHPNDDGYGVMTRAFQDAYEAVGPFGR